MTFTGTVYILFDGSTLLKTFGLNVALNSDSNSNIKSRSSKVVELRVDAFLMAEALNAAEIRTA